MISPALLRYVFKFLVATGHSQYLAHMSLFRERLCLPGILISLLVDGMDALKVCSEIYESTAWKALYDEVQLPGQGLDLIVHLGPEVKLTFFLVRSLITRLHRNFGGSITSARVRCVPFYDVESVKIPAYFF